MRSNAAIRPLPQGTKLSQTKEQNYNALLEATNHDENEALFWQEMLSGLEEKHKLVYRPGKELFQIYYVPGKNNNANKQILNDITRQINLINENWEKISKTYDSFAEYREKELSKEFDEANDKLLKLEEKRTNFLQDIANKKLSTDEQEKEITKFAETYTNERNAIQKGFSENEHVKKIQEKSELYLKKRDKILNDYFKKGNHNFDELLKDLAYKEQV